MKNRYLVFAGMGIELIGIIVGCLFIGQKMDQAYGFKGLFLAGLPLLGLAGWLVQIVKLSQKLEKNKDE